MCCISCQEWTRVSSSHQVAALGAVAMIWLSFWMFVSIMESWCLITQSCHNAFWSDIVLCCLYNTGERSFEVKTEAVSNDVTERYKAECSTEFMKIHRKSHAGEKWFSCSQCEKRFSSRVALYNHTNIHSGKYKCTECGRCCRSKRDLVVHRRSHSGEKLYSCGECEKRFSSPSALCGHRNIHRGKYKCTDCGRCCHTSRHLTIHRRSHSGEKAFECSVCSKRFTTSSHLVVHSIIHSRGKLYSCTQCEECFSYHSELSYHMNIHHREYTEVKPYSCPQCDECFSHHSALSYHMNIHRHWPKYTCTACGKCFGDRTDLAEHRQNNLGGNCLKVLFLIRDHPYARRSQWQVNFK